MQTRLAVTKLGPKKLAEIMEPVPSTGEHRTNDTATSSMCKQPERQSEQAWNTIQPMSAWKPGAFPDTTLLDDCEELEDEHEDIAHFTAYNTGLSEKTTGMDPVLTAQNNTALVSLDSGPSIQHPKPLRPATPPPISREQPLPRTPSPRPSRDRSSGEKNSIHHTNDIPSLNSIRHRIESPGTLGSMSCLALIRSALAASATVPDCDNTRQNTQQSYGLPDSPRGIKSLRPVYTSISNIMRYTIDAGKSSILTPLEETVFQELIADENCLEDELPVKDPNVPWRACCEIDLIKSGRKTRCSTCGVNLHHVLAFYGHPDMIAGVCERLDSFKRIETIDSTIIVPPDFESRIHEKDFLGNTSLHYLASSTGLLWLLERCFLDPRYSASLSSVNEFGHTPLHVLNPAHFERGLTNLPGFLKQLATLGLSFCQRDSDGRTFIHKLFLHSNITKVSLSTVAEILRITGIKLNSGDAYHFSVERKLGDWYDYRSIAKASRKFNELRIYDAEDESLHPAFNDETGLYRHETGGFSFPLLISCLKRDDDYDSLMKEPISTDINYLDGNAETILSTMVLHRFKLPPGNGRRIALNFIIGLIQTGADLNINNRIGLSPLVMAIRMGQHDLIESIFHCDIKVPLLRRTCARLLIEAHSYLNRVDVTGQPYLAALKAMILVMKYWEDSYERSPTVWKPIVNIMSNAK